MTDTRLAGPVVDVTAGANLGGHRAVAIIGGEAIHADNSNIAHRGLVRGITTGATSEGETARVQIYGPMLEGAWNWTPAQPIYVGANGGLTQTAPTSGWLQPIAVADTPTQIFIDPQPVIVLV